MVNEDELEGKYQKFPGPKSFPEKILRLQPSLEEAF
jgi:hypothetical protein